MQSSSTGQQADLHLFNLVKQSQIKYSLHFFVFYKCIFVYLRYDEL